MNDIFDSYLVGAKKLLTLLSKDDPIFIRALTLQTRLIENIIQAQQYGDNENLRSDRARLISTLNTLSLKTIGITFNELFEDKSIHHKKLNNKKIKILFLASNPIDTSRLRLDHEIREIDDALRRTPYRDRFDLRQAWAVRVSDVQESLLRHRPQIVHFSGHGSCSGEIVLENAFGLSNPISKRSLSKLFSLFQEDIICVVLNACYTEEQATGLIEFGACVIGISNKIDDDVAITFAKVFYQGLGYGEDVKSAFDLGCAQLTLEFSDDIELPKLLSLKTNSEKVKFINGSDDNDKNGFNS